MTIRDVADRVAKPVRTRESVEGPVKDIGGRVIKLEQPIFPKAVPRGEDTVQLYDGSHISAEDAAWLPGCYFPATEESYESNWPIM